MTAVKFEVSARNVVGIAVTIGAHISGGAPNLVLAAPAAFVAYDPLRAVRLTRRGWRRSGLGRVSSFRLVVSQQGLEP